LTAGPRRRRGEVLRALFTQGDGVKTEIYLFDPSPGRRSVPGWVLAEILGSGRAECRSYGAAVFCRQGRKIEVRHSDGIDEAEPPTRLKPEAWYYYVPGRGFAPVEVRGGIYARLHSPRAGAAPTLLINGIHMHRVAAGWDPLRDADAKVKYLHAKKGSLVLDTCMGLGYTAIRAMRRGARVVTIEVSREVLAVAEHNPYSASLAEAEAILVGDAADYVKHMQSSVFDAVMHDPPRYSVAGHLYSLSFYRELFRVLRPGGRLVHYTGEPQRGRGRGRGPIVRGVVERLAAAGFRVLGYREDALSVVAVKPRR